ILTYLRLVPNKLLTKVIHQTLSSLAPDEIIATKLSNDPSNVAYQVSVSVLVALFSLARFPLTIFGKI
ncbi:MAG: hypothetical protein ACKODM_15910, partial [Cytophagales bacterium]